MALQTHASALKIQEGCLEFTQLIIYQCAGAINS